MIFNFGKYKIDVDVEKTHQYYEKVTVSEYGCGCDGCKNFILAVEQAHQDVRNLFESLGIPIKKVEEKFVVFSPEKDNLLYGGFTYLCGSLIKQPKGKKRSVQLENISLSFTNEGGFVSQYACDNFPRPAFRMDFYFNLPWVLDKENEYFGEYINTINKTNEPTE